MNKSFVYQKFVEKHGNPDCEKSLNLYLDMVFKTDFDYSGYNENHHILPRSVFPDFINTQWNFVKLPYEYHVKAHVLLFKSFNIRSYQRAVNFMDKQFKDKLLISNAAKKGWNNLKLNNEKFEKFCNDRSLFARTLTSQEQSRRSKLGWDKLNKDDYRLRCIINKNNWNDVNKKEKSLQMKNYFKNNPGESTRRLRVRYKNMSLIERSNFKEKMTEVNNNKIKKERAGNTIKLKWETDNLFKNKMKNRLHKPLQSFKITFPNNDIVIIEGFYNMINKFNFNSTLVRTYKNTNEFVKAPLKQANSIKNKNTIGCKFEQIK